MRLIQATIPPEVVDAVEQLLAEIDADYFTTHEVRTDEYDEVLYISVPEERVEAVLEKLHEAGLSSDDHVVIIDTDVDIFGRTDDHEAGGDDHARIAAAELEGQVDELLPDYRTYLSMMVLSTIVAATGLLLDSAAVVVGAMVLAPLFGPAVSTSVGTVIDRPHLFRTGVRYQIIGVVVAVVTAILFAALMRVTYLVPAGADVIATPQIAERLSPDFLSLIVAFVAGIAGVLSIATGAGIALVGVMMAAALLPPAATVGIGIAWGEPLVAINSGILLLVNVLAINFAGLATLWYLGYRPQTWVRIPQTRRELLKRSSVLLVALLVTSAFLLNVTYVNAQQSQVETAIEEDIHELLDEPAYENVSLLNVKVIQEKPALTRGIDRVSVTLGRPPWVEHPGLRRAIEENVTDRVGQDVPVTVQVSLLLQERPDPAHPSGEDDQTPANRTNETAVPPAEESTPTADSSQVSDRTALLRPFQLPRPVPPARDAPRAR